MTALQQVISGQLYVSPLVAQRLLNQAAHGRKQEDGHFESMHCLSDRELQVLELIGHGQTTKAIARQLHLSIHTVDTHRENIRRKLSVKNSAELMQLAVQWVLEHV